MQLMRHSLPWLATKPAADCASRQRRIVRMPVVRLRLDKATVAMLFAAMFLVAVWPARPAAADSGLGTTTTLFHESGGPLDMTVIVPSAALAVDLGDDVTVRGNWEADVVSGASVAVVDGGGDVDVVTGATMLDDVRHTVGGDLQMRGEYTSLTLGYAYGLESDYRSHGISIAARAEMFERNTAFALSYGRGFDQVCNLAQPRAQEPVDRQRLPNSDGCFVADDREASDLSLQTLQGSWTQNWTPILTTQATVTAQLQSGYQGNPYRAVWLGSAAAQEHHPANRARYAGGLGVRLWIKPLEGALQLFGRAYRDTWDVRSITAEIAYEQTLLERLRIRGRARYYTQTAAAFFSDDYAFQPRGQYFTGDRELSSMRSFIFGGRIEWAVPGDEDGDVLGFLASLSLVGKFDWLLNQFEGFHYGQAAVPNTDAIMATIGLEAVF